MRLYTEATDGSSIETKESAIVWHHQDADPDFGSCQAKELLDHLESVLANEPAVVKRGQHIVEVKPQVLSSTACFCFDVSLTCTRTADQTHSFWYSITCRELVKVWLLKRFSREWLIVGSHQIL